MKNNIIKNLVFVFGLLISAPGSGQSLFQGKEHLFTQPYSYYVYQVAESIIIDGVANEPSWQRAPWSSYFIDIEGNLKPRPLYETRFKMLWDNQNLYIHAELEEPHLWGTLAKHDEIVYNNNDFEIFIDPDGDTHQYYEIEVNVLKTIFDLYMNKPYRNGGKPHINWNAANLKTAVAIAGTLNKSDDTDKNWTLEMAIPFSSLSMEKPTPIPQNKTVWRMNFSRVQWNLDILENQYQRKKDTNNKLLPEYNWVWSEQGVINMHFPERWGYIIFSDQPVGSDTFTIPFSEYIKNYLWLTYYKQKDFFAVHKQYAKDLQQLGFSSDKINVENQSCNISMKAGEQEFLVNIHCKQRKEYWQLNQEGLVKKNKR